jgi:hypothetical protein
MGILGEPKRIDAVTTLGADSVCLRCSERCEHEGCIAASHEQLECQPRQEDFIGRVSSKHYSSYEGATGETAG